jgi:hypothetical protein
MKTYWLVTTTFASLLATAPAWANCVGPNCLVSKSKIEMVMIENRGEIFPQCKLISGKVSGLLRGSGFPSNPFSTRSNPNGGVPAQVRLECNTNTSVQIINAQAVDSIAPALPNGSIVQHSFGDPQNPGGGSLSGQSPMLLIGTGTTPLYIHTEISNPNGLQVSKHLATPIVSIP